MNEKIWRFIQIGTVILWGITIYLWVALNFPYLFIILAALHIGEAVNIGPKVGTRHGYSTMSSVVLTLIFGFTWWLPVKKGII